VTPDDRPAITILVPADDPQARGSVPAAAEGPHVEVAPQTGPHRGRPGRSAAGAEGDVFPTARFGEIVRRLPAYLRLAWGLAGEPSLPRSRRAGVIAAAAYLASPVDLIPGVIPVVGQLDDVAVTVLALRAALRALDEPTRQRVLADAGMTQDDLDRDLQTAGLAALWLGRRGVHLSRRLAGLAARATVALGRTGGRLAGRAVARTARAGRDATPRVAALAGRAAGSVGRAGVAAAGQGATAAGQGASALGQGASALGQGVTAVGRGAAATAGHGTASAGRVLGRLGRGAGRVRRRVGNEEPAADPAEDAAPSAAPEIRG
jgi:uncharacterized membrane protein YkvA (DUF1232 family)